MSLRRTALARKSELKRQARLARTPLARGKGLRARSVKAARPRNTGPTPAQRNLVVERASGCCELCGTRLFDESWTGAHSFHHRQPRGMGGTKRVDVNSPSNILLVCGTGTTGCHGFIESHRTAAEREGWLVRHGIDPATAVVTVYAPPISVRSWDGKKVRDLDATRRVLLTEDGDYQEGAA